MKTHGSLKRCEALLEARPAVVAMGWRAKHQAKKGVFLEAPARLSACLLLLETVDGLLDEVDALMAVGALGLVPGREAHDDELGRLEGALPIGRRRPGRGGMR